MPTKPRAYAHPVLSNQNSNFKSGYSFDCSLQLELASECSVLYVADLENDVLRDMTLDGQVRMGLDVYCPTTLQRHFLTLDELKGVAKISETSLFGEIEATLFLYATKDLHDYKPLGISDEYTAKSFTVSKGAPLAISPTYIFEIAPDTTRRPEFLKFALSNNVPDYYFELDPSGNSLILFVGKKLYEAFNTARQSESLRPMLFPALFQDIFSDALSALQAALTNADEEHTLEKAWAKHLISSLGGHEIALDADSDCRRVAAMLLFDRGWGKILEDGEGE